MISFTTILLGVSLFANSVAMYRKPISLGISDGTTMRRMPSQICSIAPVPFSPFRKHESAA
ncbi:hypothetical protein FOXYSP1_19085 [Fusarium oxysporum f. sp. phaseoli]